MSEHRFGIKDREARMANGRSFDRNRQAKYRFLSDTNDATFQRGSTARRSLPGKSRIDHEAEDMEAKYIDLSVPGTPVSSRYVMAMKYRNKLAEESQAEREKDFEAQLSDEDPLKRFLESMKALNAQKSQESSIVVEVPTKPTLQRRNSYGYNNIGTWNSSSNLQGYTVLFQRSMSAKVEYNQDYRQQQQSAQPSSGPNDDDITDEHVTSDTSADKVNAMEKENEVSAEGTQLSPPSHACDNADKISKEPDIQAAVPPQLEITKTSVKHAEVVGERINDKTKSKDKSKNKYMNFWRKLTGQSGAKDQDKKMDTRN
ncbi:hypothetical protein DMENIID0001_073630 [Sergentomyia squamirostris]